MQDPHDLANPDQNQNLMIRNIVILYPIARLPLETLTSNSSKIRHVDLADVGTEIVGKTNYIGIFGVGGGCTQTTVASPRLCGIFEVGGGGAQTIVSSPRFFCGDVKVGMRVSMGFFVVLRLRATEIVWSSRLFWFVGDFGRMISMGLRVFLRLRASSVVLSRISNASFLVGCEMWWVLVLGLC